MDEALAYIEARLHEPLTVAQIAAASGLSPFHFSRLFTAMRGQSVMAYVRTRRLQLVVGRLATESDVRLIDLAFDCGFESQQAFTRAFTRAFGVSPGRFRRAGPGRPDLKGDISMTTTIDLGDTLVMQPEPVRKGAFRVAGLSGSFDTNTRPEILRLWARFVPHLPVAGQIDGTAYGLCWSQSPEEGFRYMAAAQIAPDAPEPEGLETLEVPAQTYCVFRQSLTGGELQPQMTAAVQEIWGRRLPAAGLKPSGGPDFEFYPPDFQENRPGAWLEYYVPVQG